MLAECKGNLDASCDSKEYCAANDDPIGTPTHGFRITRNKRRGMFDWQRVVAIEVNPCPGIPSQGRVPSGNMS